MTLTATAPEWLAQGEEGEISVVIGPDGAVATGTLRVESTPTAGGDSVVVGEEPAQPGQDPVAIPFLADVSRHYGQVRRRDHVRQRGGAGVPHGGPRLGWYEDPGLPALRPHAAVATGRQPDRSGIPGNVGGRPDQVVALTAASDSHSAADCRTAPSAAATTSE